MTSNPPPRFASDFGAMLLDIYGELCAAREKADPDEMIVAVKRAESSVNNTSAIIILGSSDDIDEFAREYKLD